MAGLFFIYYYVIYLQIVGLYSQQTSSDTSDGSSSCLFDEVSCAWRSKFKTNAEALNQLYPSSRYPLPIKGNAKGSNTEFFVFFFESATRTENLAFSADQFEGGCITFWYFMSGKLSCNLTLNLNEDLQNSYALWTTPRILFSEWKFVQLNVALKSSKYRLTFDAYFDECGIGLDDIKYTKTACSSDQYCHFEQGTCGYENAVNSLSVKPWRLVRGQQVATKPSIDHTFNTDLGTFFWTNETLMNQSGLTEAILSVPSLPQDVSCIEFAYYFTTNGKNSLELNLHDSVINTVKPLWSTTYSSRDWEVLRVSFDSKLMGNNFTQLYFTYKSDNEPSNEFGSAAIDDVKFLSTCQSIGSCNFEQDFCSWHVISKNGGNFNRAQGDFQEKNELPIADTTYGTDAGYYIFIQQSLSDNETATLESAYLKANVNYSFSFNYHHLSNNQHGPEIDISILLAENEHPLKLNYTLSKDEKWNSLQIQLGPYPKPFRILIQPIFSHSSFHEFLAFDDFEIVEGSYMELEENEEKERKTCQGSSIEIEESQICNFISDCPEHDDEINCGECDYEKADLCGWSEADLGTVNIIDASKTDHNKPQFDATYNVKGKGKYLDLSGPILKRIISPERRSSSDECFIEMYLYAVSNHSKQLSFKIFVENIPEMETMKIFEITKGLSPKWNDIKIHIGQFKHFKLIIEAESMEDEVIALDQITYGSRCASPKPENKTSCSGEQFYCSRMKKCISKNAVCDFRDDCGDGEDEHDDTAHCNLRAGRCDFESGFCDWIPSDNLDSNNNNLWIIQEGNELNYSRPTRDHTKNSPTGHYAMINLQNLELYYTLISPRIFKSLETKSVCIFSFYYTYTSNHLDEQIVSDVVQESAELEVYYTDSEHLKFKKIFSISAQKGTPFNSFQRINLLLDSVFTLVDNGLRLSINATSNEQKTGSWSIDDIALTSGCEIANCFQRCPDSGACLSYEQICDFQNDCPNGYDQVNCTSVFCNFDENVCDWVMESPTTIGLPGEQWFPMVDGSGSSSGRMVVFNTSLNENSLLISHLIGQSSSRCHLRFRYFCPVFSKYFKECGLGIIIDSNNRREEIWHSMSDHFIAKSSGRWISVNVFIGVHRRFRILFEGTYFLRSQGVIIDNVEFASCEPPKHAADGICSSEQFQCTNGACIDRFKVNDFVDDCLDGSDEIISGQPPIGRCDFESNCSFWTLEPSSGDNKFSLLGTSRSAYQPARDHTTNSHSGNFLTLLSSGNSESEYVSGSIVSPVINSTGNSDCHLKFWYNLIGSTSYLELKVSAITSYGPDGEHILLIEGPEDLNDFWKYSSVDLSEIGVPFILKITGSILSTIKGSINIDDITLTKECELSSNQNLINETGTTEPAIKIDCEPGYSACRTIDRCYPSSAECNFKDDCGDGTDESSCPSVCDFSQGLCGWSSKSELTWQRVNAKSIAGNPLYPEIIDHTTNSSEGYFMVTGKSIVNDNDRESSAALESPIFSSSGPRCSLKFFYYSSFSSDIQSAIQVILNKYPAHNNSETENDLIWTLNGVTERGWKQAYVHVGNIDQLFSLTIELQFNYGSIGDTYSLAIDDLIFEDCASVSKEPMENCSLTEWECAESKCIPVYQLCDGISDCSDNGDEAKCSKNIGDCDFNSDWKTSCDWSNTVNSSGQWKHSNEDWRSEGIIASDYLSLTSPTQDLVTGILVGPQFNASKGQCHMTLQFHYLGQDARLEVGIVKEKTGYSEVAVLDGRYNTLGWLTAHWVLDSDEPYRVLLIGELYLFYSEAMINFVRFSPNCASGNNISIDSFPGYKNGVITTTTTAAATTIPVTTTTAATSAAAATTTGATSAAATTITTSTIATPAKTSTTTKTPTTSALTTTTTTTTPKSTTSKATIFTPKSSTITTKVPNERSIKNAGKSVYHTVLAIIITIFAVAFVVIGLYLKKRREKIRIVANASNSNYNIPLPTINTNLDNSYGMMFDNRQQRGSQLSSFKGSQSSQQNPTRDDNAEFETGSVVNLISHSHY